MIPKALDHEDGELTATQKVKRTSMMKLFDQLVADMYDNTDALAGGDLVDVIVPEREPAGV
jgi:long-chain acyl-CoA synthetase